MEKFEAKLFVFGGSFGINRENKDFKYIKSNYIIRQTDNSHALFEKCKCKQWLDGQNIPYVAEVRITYTGYEPFTWLKTGKTSQMNRYYSDLYLIFNNRNDLLRFELAWKGRYDEL
jgi:hypothetical protein